MDEEAAAQRRCRAGSERRRPACRLRTTLAASRCGGSAVLVLVLLSAWLAGARPGERAGELSAEAGRDGWQGGGARPFSGVAASLRAHAMAKRGGASLERVPDGSSSEEVLAASRAAAGMLHRQLSDNRPADRLEDAKRAVALLHEQLQQVRAGMRPGGQALSSSPAFQRQILRGATHQGERGVTGTSPGESFAQHAGGRLLSLAGVSEAGRARGGGERGEAEMREEMERVEKADRRMGEGDAQGPGARASDRKEAGEVLARAACSEQTLNPKP